MRINIEELFKQSLEHHEENYDPSAWDALQSKLDSKQETNKKNKVFELEDFNFNYCNNRSGWVFYVFK